MLLIGFIFRDVQVELWKKFKHLEKELSDLGSSGEEDDRCSVLRGQVKEAESEFFQSACKLPNRTHPDAVSDKRFIFTNHNNPTKPSIHFEFILTLVNTYSQNQINFI